MPTILDLPLEIYLLICERLCPIHIKRLTQTCRSLHRHLHKHLWATATATGLSRITIAQHAARTGALVTLQKIVSEYGYDPHYTKNGSSTVLDLAVDRGHEGIVAYLLPYYEGGDREKMRRIVSAVKVAASHGFEAIVALILGYGFDLTLEDRYQVLDMAARGGSVATAKAVLGTPSRGMLDISGAHGFLISVIRGGPYCDDEERQREMVALLIEHGADVNVLLGNSRETALMVAAQKKRVWAVEMLLGAGANVNATDRYGNAALHIACAAVPPLPENSGGWAGMVTMLLESGGCDVEIRNRDGCTPMRLAIRASCFYVVRLLLDYGAVLDAWDSGDALRLAAEDGDIGTVSEILDKGADVNEVGWRRARMRSGGWTPLARAANKGRIEMMAFLVARGAVVDPGSKGAGFTAFHVALGRGHVEAARWLLDRGADITSSVQGEHPWDTWLCSKGGHTCAHTALHFAALGGKDCLQFILDAGLQRDTESTFCLMVAAREGKRGRDLPVEEIGDLYRMVLALGDGDGDPFNAVAWLFVHITDIRPDVVRALFEYAGSAADVNMVDTDGQTFLHSAAAYGDLETTRLLLDMGAMVDTKDSNGQTPLYLAVEHLRVEIVKLLLERGANPDGGDPRTAPLLAALLNDSAYRLVMTLREDDRRQRLDAILDVLVEYGADLNRIYDGGWTLLPMTVDPTGISYPETAVEYLLQRGVDPDQVDPKGQTALHNVVSRDWHATVKVLLDGGANANLRNHEGKTAVQVAEEWGWHSRSLDLLLRHMYP